MKGESIYRASAHIEVNKAIFKEPTPVVKEKDTPLKDVKAEKDSLFLSYLTTERECLTEISVSPKGELLLGKFVMKDCQRPSVLQEKLSKGGSNAKFDRDYQEGRILLIKE